MRSKSTTTAIMAVVVVIACLMLSVFPSKSANNDILEQTPVVDISPLVMSATMVQYSAKPEHNDVEVVDPEEPAIVEETPVIVIVDNETPPKRIIATRILMQILN